MKRKSRRWVISAIAAVGVLSIALAALAAPSFTDVPESHPFYEEIEAIKAAGITTGSTECNPLATPAFCPDSNVRRDAMAAFMERGYGRILSAEAVSDTSTAVSVNNTEELIRLTAMFAGATGGGNGYLHVSATGHATESAGCPCLLVLTIVDQYGNEKLWPVYVEPGGLFKPFSFQTVVPMPADSGTLIGLTGILGFTSDPTDEVSVVADLVATYVPFDHTADNTAGEVVSPTSLPGSAADLPLNGLSSQDLAVLEQMGVGTEALDR